MDGMTTWKDRKAQLHLTGLVAVGGFFGFFVFFLPGK